MNELEIKIERTKKLANRGFETESEKIKKAKNALVNRNKKKRVKVILKQIM